MMKKIYFPLLAIVCSTLIACGPAKNNSSSVTSSGEEQVMKITYDEIYNYKPTKSQELSGAVNYRASDGYIENETQGYNHFYYRAMVNNQKLDMVYDGEAFSNEGAKLKGKEMISTATASSIREFISPEKGEAKIRTSAFLKEGTNANIVVKINDVIFYQGLVGKEGYYFSKSTNLNIGDIVSFELIGDAIIECNPEIDFSNKNEGSLHGFIDGHYGDVHPFYNYEEKKMYMYYLSTGNQTQGKKKDIFQSLLATSNDFINYKDDELQMDDDARPEQDLYYVLNVFKDADGKYRSYMGMGNHATSSISDDLHTWRNGIEPYVDPADDLFKYRHTAYNDADVISSRDPDTFYDKDSESYYCVILSYMSQQGAKGEKWINMYVGNKKGEFSTVTTKMVNFTGRGDAECPQIKKIGNRWYLFYSPSGTGTMGNVGRMCYRVGPENTLPQNVDWNNLEERYINGQDLHAAQLVQVGDKYYVYGWLNYKYNTSVWGGYLNTPVEVYQGEDGLLYSRLDPKLLALVNKGLIYKEDLITSSKTLEGTFDRTLINADFKQTEGKSYITVSEGERTFLVGIEYSMGKPSLVIRNEKDGYVSSIEIKNNSSYHLDIMVDDNFIEVSCNGEQVLSAITGLSINSDTIGLTLGQGTEVSNLKINKLSANDNLYL